jgi:hypothetical protein
MEGNLLQGAGLLGILLRLAPAARENWLLRIP